MSFWKNCLLFESAKISYFTAFFLSKNAALSSIYTVICVQSLHTHQASGWFCSDSLYLSAFASASLCWWISMPLCWVSPHTLKLSKLSSPCWSAATTFTEIILKDMKERRWWNRLSQSIKQNTGYTICIKSKLWTYIIYDISFLVLQRCYFCRKSCSDLRCWTLELYEVYIMRQSKSSFIASSY